MKNVISIITVGVALVLNTSSVNAASELETDDLTVNQTAKFYGTVEIKSIVPQNPTNGMSLFYSFATNSAPLVIDDAGCGSTGTVTGATYLSGGGKTNSAYWFDGTNDMISVAYKTNWNFGTNSFTICWWEKRKVGVNEGVTVCRDSNAMSPFILAYYWNGTLDAYITSDGSNWDVGVSTFGDATIGSWVHLAITRNGTNFCTYKDGSVVGSWTSTLGIKSSALPLDIGRGQGSHYANADIDEFRIYNRGLSASEIQGLYYYYNPGLATNQASLSVENISVSNSVNQSGTTVTNYFMGRVGIGTNSPATNVILHISGNTRVDGTLTTSTSPVSTNDVGNMSFNDGRYAQLGAGTNGFTGAASFGQGILNIKQLGDVGMGVYTNGP